MNKAQLLDLTERVKLVAGVELPNQRRLAVAIRRHLAGSRQPQALCRMRFPPTCLRPSCLPRRHRADRFAGSIQETHGYYADAVGLATVLLPTGWQERLAPLTDEAGKMHAYCLEVHDTCVS